MTYYLSASEFAAMYPNKDAGMYNKFAWDAQKYIDSATMTVDGVKKLQYAFPIDEDDEEAVKRCMGAIIVALDDVDEAREAMSRAGGYTSTTAGVVSNNVRSVSAGGESISYGVDANAKTEAQTAAQELTGRTDEGR